MLGWLRRKSKEQEPDPRFLDKDDPLSLAVNRAWNTGEPVSWSQGEPLPEPGGPNRPVER
jgi:hypothetical protein